MYKKFFKRIFGFILSIILLILFSPILVLIVLVLLLTGEHKVFFIQERIGYKNTIFRVWKFRTMYANTENLGTGSITVHNDPRVLPVGKVLNSCKMNELPQLINVLKGDMSIVGARPQMKNDFEKYPEEVQQHIYATRPGITGVGSIIFRNEDRWTKNHNGDVHEFYKQHIAPYKGEVEMWYQQNISFSTDVKLIFLTALTLFCSSNELIYKVFKTLPPKPQILIKTK